MAQEIDGTGGGGGRLPFAKPERVKLDKASYWRFKNEVHELDRWRCLVCGHLRPLTIHHIVKRSDQRLDTKDNCISCCVECHDGIEGHRIILETWDPKRRFLTTSRAGTAG